MNLERRRLSGGLEYQAREGAGGERFGIRCSARPLRARHRAVPSVTKARGEVGQVGERVQACLDRRGAEPACRTALARRVVHQRQTGGRAGRNNPRRGRSSPGPCQRHVPPSVRRRELRGRGRLDPRRDTGGFRSAARLLARRRRGCRRRRSVAPVRRRSLEHATHERRQEVRPAVVRRRRGVIDDGGARHRAPAGFRIREVGIDDLDVGRQIGDLVTGDRSDRDPAGTTSSSTTARPTGPRPATI